MLYADFCECLELIKGMDHLAKTDDILAILVDYADMAPEFPWRGIVRIRAKGYVSSVDLHTILTQHGFQRLVIDQIDADLVTQYRSERWSNTQQIKPHVVVVVRTIQWIDKFAKYFRVDWRTGKPTKHAIQLSKQLAAKPYQRSIPATVNHTPEWFDQQTRLYHNWTAHEQIKEAQDHFLRNNSDFIAVTDQEMVDAIISGWRDGTIPINASQVQMAEVIRRDLRVIRKSGRAKDKTFNIFVTSDQVNHLFGRVTGKSYATVRDEMAGEKTVKAPEHSTKTHGKGVKNKIIKIDVSRLSDQQADLLRLFVQALLPAQ